MGFRFVILYYLTTVAVQAHSTLRAHPVSHLSNNVKRIDSYIPTSKYNIDLVTPRSEIPGRRLVPLYLIPEDTFHIYNSLGHHYGSGRYEHLPGIEIPLSQPLVLGSTQSEMSVPIGYNVNMHGSIRPFYTCALFAPIPSRTHVSSDSPVVINVVYALPRLTGVYSFLKTKLKSTVTTVTKRPQNLTTSIRPSTDDAIVVDTKLAGSSEDTVSISHDEPSIPVFENAKESPYLQELRLESLRRQVQELQDQIRKLKRLRN